MKRLMNDFKHYGMKLLACLTNLVLRRNKHVFVDSRYIGITFLQKRSINTNKGQYIYYSLKLNLVTWNLVLVKKKDHQEIITKLIMKPDENKINKLKQCLTEKWDNVSLQLAYFHDQLLKWRSLCMRQLWFIMGNF